MLFNEEILLKTAFEIVKKLQNNGFTAFFVGGCIRDKMLGKHIQDVDIATSALPAQIKRLFKKTYDIGVAFGIVNVVENGMNFEVATFRREDDYTDGRRPTKVEYTIQPEEDAKRRDFTINAMFYDPVKNKIYDFFDGRSDLKNGIIKCIGDPKDRFLEDYLRILRAVRFGIRFNFKIDDSILSIIKRYCEKLKKLSSERIRDELNKIFMGPRPDMALQLLSDTGILKIVLPEIEFLKGIKQPEQFHPEGDVFTHTKLMLSRMVAPSVELVWSVLLHDIGKPCTFHIDSSGRPRFFCHETKGCEIADFIMKRLNFSNDIRKKVSVAVRNHMRFAHVMDMRKAKWQRMIISDNFSLEFELHRLDAVCSNGRMDGYLFLLDKLVEFKGRPKIEKLLLTGNDLKKLGIKTGPLYSEILKEVEERQISGEIKDEAEAFFFVKNKYL